MLGCSNNQPPQPINYEENIISSIIKECGIEHNFKQMDGVGEMVYHFPLTDDNFYQIKVKAKNIVERELNTLPFESKENQKMSVGVGFYDDYKWETPKIKVVMEVENSDYRKDLGLWITNK
jgi:hypothetical protein